MHLAYLHTDFESPLSERGFVVVHQAVVPLPHSLLLPLSNTNPGLAEEALISRLTQNHGLPQKKLPAASSGCLSVSFYATQTYSCQFRYMSWPLKCTAATCGDLYVDIEFEGFPCSRIAFLVVLSLLDLIIENIVVEVE